MDGLSSMERRIQESKEILSFGFITCNSVNKKSFSIVITEK